MDTYKAPTTRALTLPELTQREQAAYAGWLLSILKEADAGASVKDICRRHGISPATWYQWKSKYGGMGASELKRTKELEAELGQMKRMYGMHPVGTTVVPTPDGAHSSNIRTPQRRCPSDAYAESSRSRPRDVRSGLEVGSA